MSTDEKLRLKIIFTAVDEGKLEWYTEGKEFP